MAKAKKTTKKVPQRVPKARTKFYLDKAGKWRWQIKTGAFITAASTEGYNLETECRENYFKTCINMSNYINTVIVPDKAKILSELNNALANDYLEFFKDPEDDLPF